MELLLQAPLFQPSTSAETSAGDTPESMADKFGVPYLGKLPMDPNMMNACERGESFLQTYANSVAAAPFAMIVEKIVEKTQQAKRTYIEEGSVTIEMNT